MQWRNTSSRYGVFSLFLHWGSALVVFGLFGLGLWMRELSYYDPWYHPAPALHKSIGILLAIALLVRIVWRFVSPPPPAPANHGPLTRVASKLGHLALYGLLLAVIVAGYLISTADGEPISVFGWFSVPATSAGCPTRQTSRVKSISTWPGRWWSSPSSMPWPPSSITSSTATRP